MRWRRANLAFAASLSPDLCSLHRNNLTDTCVRLSSWRPVRRGCFREALLKQGGMRRPASLVMQPVAREAPGQHRPSATTSGSCERTRRSHRTPPRQANVRRLRPGGLGANKPPRWSAERRASPGAQTVKASLRGDARTRVMGPLLKRVPMHPSACRRSASLVDAREIGKARRTFCLARTMVRVQYVVGWAIRAFTPVFDGLCAKRRAHVDVAAISKARRGHASLCPPYACR
jgi:hypothetical protein